MYLQKTDTDSELPVAFGADLIQIISILVSNISTLVVLLVHLSACLLGRWPREKLTFIRLLLHAGSENQDVIFPWTAV